MMRLIDADKINFLWTPIAPVYISNDVHYEPVAFKWEIDVQPTIDAKPVVHAHWIQDKGLFRNPIIKCSHCGNFLDMNGVNAGRGNANFCPNCGADMRGEQDG